jgi:hypothetical protein
MMRYCCECGNPIQENGFPDPQKEDDLPIIFFNNPIEFYHSDCFQMMLKEGKITISKSSDNKNYNEHNHNL